MFHFRRPDYELNGASSPLSSNYDKAFAEFAPVFEVGVDNPTGVQSIIAINFLCVT